jgi:hypothetical protein
MSYEYCSRSASRLYRPLRNGDTDRSSRFVLKDGIDDMEGTMNVVITR